MLCMGLHRVALVHFDSFSLSVCLSVCIMFLYLFEFSFFRHFYLCCSGVQMHAREIFLFCTNVHTLACIPRSVLLLLLLLFISFVTFIYSNVLFNCDFLWLCCAHVTVCCRICLTANTEIDQGKQFLQNPQFVLRNTFSNIHHSVLIRWMLNVVVSFFLLRFSLINTFAIVIAAAAFQVAISVSHRFHISK